MRKLLFTWLLSIGIALGQELDYEEYARDLFKLCYQTMEAYRLEKYDPSFNTDTFCWTSAAARTLLFGRKDVLSPRDQVELFSVIKNVNVDLSDEAVYRSIMIAYEYRYEFPVLFLAFYQEDGLPITEEDDNDRCINLFYTLTSFKFGGDKVLDEVCKIYHNWHLAYLPYEK